VLIAGYKRERQEDDILGAVGLLERLLKAAESGSRMGNVIEILIMLAVAYEAQDNIPAALAALERALALAEPEGYVRMFVDEASAMASLLDVSEQQGIARDYVRRLQNALSGVEDRAPVSQGLVDQLSQRELDVLRLLGTDLGGPDIARELVLSLNTVRTHTKNIYAKLGVNSRRAAVRRAGELELLSRTGRR
jgi:LuxR family maltose regulon positive regulatory protein